ncbi:tandem-95 repeat protein [Flaviramulus sp. BrNp1-15]|uniref:Ig-like domain-containing protein n=1 Tax=Flaviramulus sp. BrNp1-15 TaxID=2916754 RepID=UPI001EE87139|nr:tandem-95 repeat protein [Flaviramulus sp. BrNp1-15]ULC58956.1 tandem-95 repeat protein [Flaviramulus sp. BrNp1-15]
MKNNTQTRTNFIIVFIFTTFFLLTSSNIYSQDTDGDTYADVVDLDDDNDGILDADEGCPAIEIQWNHNDGGGQGQAITYGAGANTYFSGASNLSFGPGIFENPDYAFTYIFGGADQTTFAGAKTNGDYVEVSYTPNSNLFINQINFGYWTTNIGDIEFNMGNHKLAVEVSTNATDFSAADVLLVDMQVDNMQAPSSYVFIGNSINSYLLEANTTYYFRTYLYDEQNTDPQNRVRFDDYYFNFDADCDNDGDGLPNSLDTDSDGDGCPDAIEGAGTFTASDLDGDNSLGDVVDGNGVPSITSGGQATTAAVTNSGDASACPPDSDGDGVPDTSDVCPGFDDALDNDGDLVPDGCDLDNDNDGVLDCDEKNLLNSEFQDIFSINGTAVQIAPNEVRLTEALNNQSGQAFSFNTLSFNEDFNFSFEANLGTNDGGADGIAIVFHNDPSGFSVIGANGQGMGAGGIIDGIVLEIDTWDNGVGLNDIPNDHTSIWDSNDQAAGNLSSAVDFGNLEDGNWHLVNVTWNAGTQTISYTLNGILAGSYTGDLINNYFGGSSYVYLGFTASTGGAINNHSIRFSGFCDIPVFIDTDGDTFPNHLDTDSDGDGCPDAIEGAGTFTASDLDGDSSLGDSVDSNGIPVSASGGQATTAAVTNSGDASACPPDSDGDGVPDASDICNGSDDNADNDGDLVPDGCDLDDDNDGILDIDENSSCGTSGSISVTLFNEDFGQQPSGAVSTNLPGVGTGAVTTYTYYEAIEGTTPTGGGAGTSSPGASLQDGYYTIFDNPLEVAQWASGVWQPLGDHTDGVTATGGRMFMVNAGVAGEEFYRRTLTNVVTGAPINASLWAMNMDLQGGRNLPNFRIRFERTSDNSLLYEFDTEPIAIAASGDWANAWKFFENPTLFIPTTTDDIDIVLINLGETGAGNDLAIDDILVFQTFCDTDLDTIPDYFDADSDGDGCPDAVEAAGTFTASDLDGDNSLGDVVDGNGVPSITSGGQAITLAVTDNGDASACNPTAQDDTITGISEDSTNNTLDVLADNGNGLDDFGGDGPNVGTIGLVSATTTNGGTVTVNDGGTPDNPIDDTIDYTPASDFNGTDTFDYTITDSNGDVSTATVTVTVTPVNDAPVADDELSETTIEDTPVTINVLDGDTDAEGDVLTITEVDGTPIAEGETVAVTGGTVTLTGGELVVTPDADSTVDVSFDYTVDDGNGGTDTGSVLVDVTPVNDAPVADDELSETTNEDTPVTINVLDGDTDAEGDVLTITEVEGTPIAEGETVAVTGGTVTLTGGELVVTPDADSTVDVSFDYTVDDGNGGTDTGSVLVDVTPVNDAPVADDELTETTNEDTPVTIDVLDGDTDAEGDVLTITEVDGTPIAEGETVAVTGGTVTLTGGELVVTPDADSTVDVSFDYTVDDGNGGTDTGSVLVDVTPVNDAPVADDELSETTNEDTPVTINVLDGDTDAEGDVLTITEVEGTPIAEGETVAVTGGTVTLTGGELVVTPDADSTVDVSFDYTVDDGNGGTDTGSVLVDVTPVNDAPVADDELSETTNEDTPVTINVLDGDTDAEGDVLTITEVEGTPIAEGETVAVTGGTVTLTGGELVVTPDADSTVDVSFDYTVDDGNGGTDTGSVLVDVTPVNDAPVADDELSETTNEDTPVTINVLDGDIDAEGDILTITEVDGSPIAEGETVAVTGGTVTLTGGELVVTPDADSTVDVSFDYTVDDGNGGTDTGSVLVDVTPVNDAPVADDELSETTNEDTPVTINVLDGDIDAEGDVLTITEVDGSPIAEGETVAVTGGTVTLTGGELVVTPDADSTVDVSFDYTVDDGNGGTDTGSVLVDVTPVNDAPVADDELTETTNEDTPVTIDVLDGDTDAEGDVLTITEVDGTPIAEGETVAVTGGTVTLTGGELVVTPDADSTVDVSFDYTVDDGNGGTDTGSVLVDVTPVNDAPVADDELSETTNEDTPVTINVLDGDTDAEGDVLTITEVEGTPIAEGETVAVTGGTVTLTGGELVVTPDADSTVDVSFDYTVDDGNGGTDTGSVLVDVTPVNDAPVADDELSESTNEDTPVTIDVLDGDTDAEGDVLTITEVDGTPIAEGETVTVTGGTVTLTGGELVVTPDADSTVDVSFDYTVDDGNGGTDTGSVLVDVTPVNDAPVADDELSETTNEDTPVTIDVLDGDTDAEGDVLTITEVDGTPIAEGETVTVTGGTVTLTGGELVVTPDADSTVDVSFDYTVDDGNGGTDIGSVLVDVTPVNDAPVADDELSESTNEDTPVTIDVLDGDTDAEGDVLTITEINGSPIAEGETVTVTGGTVTLTGGELVVTPDADSTVDVSFDYTVDDGNGGTDTGSVLVDVTPVNDAPVADDELTEMTNEDTPVTINVLDGDIDAEGDVLTITEINGSPIAEGETVTVTGGTVTLTGGELVVTPDADSTVDVSFDYTVDDGNGGTDTGSVLVDVTPVNDAPVAIDDLASTDEDTPVLIDILSNDTDIDGTIDPTSVTAVTSPSNGTISIDPVTGEITYTPDAGFNGTDTFEYQVCDEDGACTTASVEVTVNDINDAPEAMDDVATTDPTVPVVIDILSNDSDIDGTIDPTSVTAVTSPSNGTISIDPVTGEITYTPNAGFSGTDTFEYQVCDDDGVCDTATVSVIVPATSLPPVANADTNTTLEDTTLLVDSSNGLLSNDTDPNPSDVLVVTEFTVMGVSYPAGTTVALAEGDLTINSDGSYEFVPATDFTGAVPQVTYTIEDGNGGSDTSTLDLTVTSVNDTPVAIDDVASTDEDTPVLIDILSNDTDIDGTIDPTSVTAVTSPSNGTISIDPVTGEITYTPNAGFNGTDSFEYQVCDEDGACTTASVEVTVNDINDAPEAMDDVATTDPTVPVVIDILSNDSDIDGTIDPTSVTAVTSPSNGTISIDPVTGEITYTPNAGFSGTDTFEYQVCDDDGVCDTATVSVIVPATSLPPVANADTNTTLEDTTLLVDSSNGLLSNDTDPNPSDVLVVTEFTVMGVSYPAGTTVALAEGDLTINSDGSYEFVPATDFTGAVPQVTYTIEDGNGGSDTSTLDLTVTSVNDTPVAIDDVASTDEDTPVLIDILSNDTDIDGTIDPTSVTAVTSPSNGTISIDPVTGEITYTPNAGFNGTDSFEYQVCDEDGACTTASVEVTVNDINDAPEAMDDVATTDPTVPVVIDILSNDSDIDGTIDPTSVTAVTSPSNGTISIDPVTGEITYTPNAGFSGTDTFEYQVCDDDDVCDTAVVTITVVDVVDITDTDGDGLTDLEETTGVDDPNTPAIPNGITDENDSCDPFRRDICAIEIEVTKTAQVFGTSVGDEIEYTIEVENTGDVVLTQLILEDIFTDANGNSITLTEEPSFISSTFGSEEGILLSGEIATYSASFRITQETINAGGVNNSVVATALTRFSELVSDTSDNGDDFDGNVKDDSTFVELGCLLVFNEFSPNGDGDNDVLIINCIENYPNNKLEIYNRWGNIVYEKKGYNNDWNGISNGRATVNVSEELPVGTYYYVLDFGDGSKPKVGWIYLNR